MPAMARALGRIGVIAALAMLTVSSCAPTAPPPELAILDSPARGTDVLPAEVKIAEGVHTIRYVGDSATSAVFAAQGPEDRPWCVLMLGGQPPGKVSTWTTNLSCADDDQFARRGVRVSVTGADGQHAAAKLLPDNFTGELNDEWQVVAPNLAVPLE
jgi:hypothetical protein